MNATASSLDRLCVDTIRTLVDGRGAAGQSGHPGTPMAMAPVATALWQLTSASIPDDPIWPNRDRFVLSGHASMLLYSMLHLTGVKAVNPKYETLGQLSVTLDDIKNFRQLDSRCPGHPEYRWTSGRRDDDGSARAGRGDQRRHGDRVEVDGGHVQPARTSTCSTTTSTRSAATAA